MRLQHELKRPVPFATIYQETLIGLLRIGDQLDNRLSRLLREQGLTLSRFNVLRILVLDDRPLTCGEIGERMVHIVPAITSLVDHLENKGLVERHRCEADRRVVYVRITEAGRKLCADAMTPLAEIETRLLSKLNRTELKSLNGLLDKVRESIAAVEL